MALCAFWCRVVVSLSTMPLRLTSNNDTFSSAGKSGSNMCGLYFNFSWSRACSLAARSAGFFFFALTIASLSPSRRFLFT